MVSRLALLATSLLVAPAAAAPDPPSWTRSVEPFRIIGPVHYVGTEGIAAYLVPTRGGAVLIDGGLPENAATIRRNVEALGVPMAQVRLILLTHAHFDHAGGLAQLKRASGARLVAGAGDRAALEAGRHQGDNANGVGTFPAVGVDRAVGDGAVVRLGGLAFHAVATPGHSPGCTSWALRVAERGRPLRVLFPCSLTVAGNALRANRGHPGIVADYRRSFTRLRAERADVVLPAHPEFADVLGRARRRAAGEADAFVDPALLGRMVAEAAAAFEAELAKQGG